MANQRSTTVSPSRHTALALSLPTAAAIGPNRAVQAAAGQHRDLAGG